MENNKPRKVLLFATMLIIAKAKEDNRLQFKSYIHVSVATVVVGSGDGVGQRFSFLRLHQPLPAFLSYMKSKGSNAYLLFCSKTISC